MSLTPVFFDRLPPFSTMFHPPTFYHRHYLGLVPSYLLDAIFALSARLSDDHKLIPADIPDAPVWSRGEAFAERAQFAIEKRVEERRSWSEEDRRRDIGTWEETEFAQANCLLSFYHTCLRSPRLALTHMDIGIATLHPTIRLSPPSQYGLSPLEQHTLRETRSRTLWILFLHDCCAAANGRPRRLLDHEMRGIPLPGNEAAWTRWGGAGAGRTEPRRRDGLEYETGDWPGEDGEIGEIGHVLRIVSAVPLRISSFSSQSSETSWPSQTMAEQVTLMLVPCPCSTTNAHSRPGLSRFLPICSSTKSTSVRP